MRLGVRSILALVTLAAACGDDSGPPVGRPVRPDSASGDVAQYALMKNAIGWLTDSNVVALASQLNADAQAIARLETEAWTQEPMRLIALEILRDHARVQYSLDSVASLRRIPAQLPAVAPELKAPYDSLLSAQLALPIAEREKRFMDMIVKVHERSTVDFGALAGNASDPDLRALLIGRALLMEQAHLSRGKLMQAAMTRADSIREDSLKARRAGRR